MKSNQLTPVSPVNDAEKTASAVMAAVTPASHRPEFIRLPPPGAACPWTGLRRSKLNELILPSDANNHKPPVKSICLRNRGQNKAVRLIVYDSLLNYLHGFSA